MRKSDFDWRDYNQDLSWKLRVACALSLNKNPETFDLHCGDERSSVGADIRREFKTRLKLLRQALESETVFPAPLRGMKYLEDVQPAHFAKWLHGLNRPFGLPAELLQLIPAPPAAVAMVTEAVSESSQTAWPWGNHTTPLLDLLAETGNQWWKSYDPEDPATAPKSADVVDWLLNKRKPNQPNVSKHIAQAIATILRPPELPAGRRMGGTIRIPQPKLSRKK